MLIFFKFQVFPSSVGGEKKYLDEVIASLH